MLDADLNVRYWGHLSRRYHARDLYSKIFLAIMSSGTVASWGFWGEIQIVWKIFSAMAAMTAIILPFLNWSNMIGKMVEIQQIWIKLQNDYDLLWTTLKDGRKAETEFEGDFKKIKGEEVLVSQKECNVPVPVDKKLSNQCYDEVLSSRGLKRRGEL